jgi:hypothetical protein
VLESILSELSSNLSDVLSKANDPEKAYTFLFVVLKDVYGADDPHLFVARETTQVTAQGKAAVKAINAARKKATDSGDTKAKKSPLSMPSRRIYGKVHYNGNFVFRTDEPSDEIKAYKEAFKKNSSQGGLLGTHSKLTKARADYTRDEPKDVPTEDSESMFGNMFGEPNDSTLDLPPEEEDESEEVFTLPEEHEDTLIEAPPPEDDDEDEGDTMFGDMLDELEPEPVDESLVKAWTTTVTLVTSTLGTVDTGLGKLKDILASSGDEELEAIAKQFFGTGFGDIHGPEKASLTSAMGAVAGTASDAEDYGSALDKVEGHAKAYLDFLKSSDKVKACAEAPEGAVAIVSLVGSSLGDLQKEIDRQRESL